jgi:hypothetical protein
MKQLVRDLYQNYHLYKVRQQMPFAKNGGHFPLDSPSRPNPSVKYGLLQYGYIEREGYWCDEINIGDYIQSIAARQFLPQVNAFIERDSIADYQGDRVRVIMNGWWHIFKGNAVPSQQIDPLYVSIHITNPKEVPAEAIAHFKLHEPIGCRDHATMNFLQGQGVDAYFSGCMTLTLGKTYAVPPAERTNTVYYVNFDRNVLINYMKSKMFITVGFTPPKVRQRLHNIVNMFFPEYAQCRHIYRDHTFPLTLSEDDRFCIADQFLRDYARAKLVITSKIHCALPCAGMGTPVLLMMTNPQDARFGGIKELLNHLGVDTSGKVIQHLFMPSGTSGHSLGGSPDIPAIVNALSERCQNFVNAP